MHGNITRRYNKSKRVKIGTSLVALNEFYTIDQEYYELNEIDSFEFFIESMQRGERDFETYRGR